MVTQTNKNLVLISFACAFGVSIGVLVLLALAYVPMNIRAPIFTIGVLVLSYFFYRINDIKLILVYSLLALGILFLLFPTFMFLGIPKAFPDYRIDITGEQAALITTATGAASIILGYTLMKTPFKGK